MKKKKKFILTVISFLILLASLLSYANDKKNKSIKEPIIINLKNSYGDVLFDHNKHTDSNCKQCHPPFDFKYNEDYGYALRGHSKCITCHKDNDVSTDCSTCHKLHKRKQLSFNPDVLKSKSKKRQKVLDFFYKRRSIRKFENKDVSDDLIVDLLKAAMSAPTAGNWQPWKFFVIKDKKIKTALSKTSPFAHYVKDAPVIIVVAGLKSDKWSPFDCAIASENLLLAAANFGLGATYAGLDAEREAYVRKVLDIPDKYFAYNLIPVGYPEKFKNPHTKYNEIDIYWGKYKKGRPQVVVSQEKN